MKVLHSYYVWLPLTMSWLYNQVRFLPDQVESHIFCDRRDNQPTFDLPLIHSLSDYNRFYHNLNFGLRKTGLGKYSPYLRNLIKKQNFDLIHAHFGNMGWEMMPLAGLAKTPLITTFYGLDVNYLPVQRPKWYRRYKDLFNYSAVVLCEGPYMKSAVQQLGCPPEKILVHHLGVDVEKLPYRPRKLTGDTVKILIAGSFREKKGIRYALQALQKIALKYPVSVTVIGDQVGEKRNQEENNLIIELMNSTELRNCVRHLGFQSHSKLIEEALDHHLFLSPSVTSRDGDTEGGAPVSLIEMTATGMPVVSTTHCDIPNIIRHNKNGLLAGERDVDGLYTHLEQLISNPDSWQDYGKKGRELVESHFDCQKQGKRLNQIYNAVKTNASLPPDQSELIQIL